MGVCMSTEMLSARTKKKEALSLEAENDQILAQIAERMCCNGSSSMGSLFCKRGGKGVNQDAMILWEDFFSRKDTVFCGVFDGHGPNGHLVARRVRNSLPSRLALEWHEVHTRYYAEGKGNSINSLGIGDANECNEPEMLSSVWRDLVLKAHQVMDKELAAHPSLDSYFSGTTAVTILKQGQHLMICNVGDSRAVLGTKAEHDDLVAVQLTVDLKPNLPQEAERINQCKGRVFAMDDEPHVHRLFLPDDSSPGLAMARAFGDFFLKGFGLIAVPEIFYRRITEKDQFIVLATDGIWEVLSNAEVVDIVSKAPSKAAAAKCVVQSAVRSWRRKHAPFMVDDCAVACLFLDAQPVEEANGGGVLRSATGISK